MLTKEVVKVCRNQFELIDLRRFMIIRLLFLLSSFSFFGVALAEEPPVGSPEWCAIHKVCDDPATGPDVGSDEWKRCQAKGGCQYN
ncbi:hypothetical protein [Arsenophonus sp.]|uniref:hypothetical protein n=1 Tax=Arsenophonus sp. TaxID=1872640 RepID=UPI00387946B1